MKNGVNILNHDVEMLIFSFSSYIPMISKIELHVPYSQVGEEFNIVNNAPAMLVINKEDTFTIPFSVYKSLFSDLKGSSQEDLIDNFNLDEDRLLYILSYLECIELEINKKKDFFNQEEDLYYFKHNKLYKVSEKEQPRYWQLIENDLYCLWPLSDYLIIGSIEDSNIRIFEYGVK